MTISQLLAQREAANRQARLANLAFALTVLEEIARRISRGNLRGLVHLQQADDKEDRYWATLRAVAGPQSVLDEHFDEEDINDLADAIGLIMDIEGVDVVFPIEELAARFVGPLAAELERSGVSIADSVQPPLLDEAD